MFVKYLLCIILYSKVCLSNVPLPLADKNSSSDIVNNKTYLKDVEHKKWAARIMNGWPAKLGDVPYQISLKGLQSRSKALYTNFCGATIVRPRKLISAAHCFEQKEWFCSKLFRKPGKITGKSLDHMYAVAGNIYSTAKFTRDGPNGQWRTLESVTHPKKYKFPKMDIAVVITDDPFYYNNFIRPIPVAIKNIDYSGLCTASGFGRTGHTKKETSKVLLIAHLQVFPNAVCKQIYKKPMHAFVCTDIRTSDVGKGDSGGPLVCATTGDPNEKSPTQGVLVGVVSGHKVKTGSFFSRVSSYKKFIASVNSVSMIMYKFTMQSCTAISMSVLYKILYFFDLFYFLRYFFFFSY